MSRCIALYYDFDIQKKMLPFMYKEFSFIKKITDIKGIIYVEAIFPFPFWNRDFYTNFAGVPDF